MDTILRPLQAAFRKSHVPQAAATSFRKSATALFSVLSFADASRVASSTMQAELDVVSTAELTLDMFSLAALVPLEASEALRLISPVAASCS